MAVCVALAGAAAVGHVAAVAQLTAASCGIVVTIGAVTASPSVQSRSAAKGWQAMPAAVVMVVSSAMASAVAVAATTAMVPWHPLH